MKWFLCLCALAVGIAVAGASCGPQKDLCPTSNPDENDLTCHANNDAQSMGGTMGTLCDGSFEYVCQGVHQCTPCPTN